MANGLVRQLSLEAKGEIYQSNPSRRGAQLRKNVQPIFLASVSAFVSSHLKQLQICEQRGLAINEIF